MPIVPRLLVIFFVVATATAARAQTRDEPCHPVSPTSRVVVRMHDGASISGTLLCLTRDDFVLAQNGSTATLPLAAVRRIDTRADPVWDGALKGAAIPLIAMAVFCMGECELGAAVRAAAGYGLIGLTIDALQSHRRTIYVGRPAPSIRWRISF